MKVFSIYKVKFFSNKTVPETWTETLESWSQCQERDSFNLQLRSQGALEMAKRIGCAIFL